MVGEQLKKRIEKLLLSYEICDRISSYEKILVYGVDWAEQFLLDYLKQNGFKPESISGNALQMNDKGEITQGKNIHEYNTEKTIVLIVTYRLDVEKAVFFCNSNHLRYIIVNCFEKRDSHFIKHLQDDSIRYEIKNILALDDRDELISWMVKANAECGRVQKGGKRCYVFLTSDVSCIGGMQLYVLGKSRFLEANGWKVFVFHCGIEMYESEVPGLKKYVGYSIPELCHPIEDYTKSEQNEVLEIMEAFLGPEASDVIIESQAECFAVWGELFAKRIKGKHYIFNCNELFRGEGKYYLRYMDFLKFKHSRRELATTSVTATKMLFDGVMGIKDEECIVFDPVERSPIDEEVFFDTDSVPKGDYNICYFGRTNKGYFEPIVEGVREFADSVPDSTVHFLVIGLLGETRMSELKKDSGNIVYSFMGNMVPVPSKIFENIDVVIAGSDSAYYAALVGVPVIISDAGNFKANGILGYDTYDLLYSEDYNTQMSYKEALDRALISKDYLNKPFKFNYRNPEAEYEKHMELIKQSSSEVEYYNFA